MAIVSKIVLLVAMPLYLAATGLSPIALISYPSGVFQRKQYTQPESSKPTKNPR